MAPSSEFADAVHDVLRHAAERLYSHSSSEAPYESVGLISLKGTVYPLINQRRSAHEFYVSPIFVEEGVQWFRNRNDKAFAFYHSHPTTSADPSPADRSMMESAPSVPHVIVGIDRIAAYLWHDGETTRLTEVARGEHSPVP